MVRTLLPIFRLCLVMLSLFATIPVFAERSDGSTEESGKGLFAGDNISMFLVTKIAGAEDDGVESGATTCYRCKYAQHPMVMVFTRSTDNAVLKLVKELDAKVAARADDKLKGIVTLIGAAPATLADRAEGMANKVAAKHVPIVVAKDSHNGPESYQLDLETAVTVVLVNHSQVVARHDFMADKIDVAAVLSQVDEMLK